MREKLSRENKEKTVWKNRCLELQEKNKNTSNESSEDLLSRINMLENQNESLRKSLQTSEEEKMEIKRSNAEKIKDLLKQKQAKKVNSAIFDPNEDKKNLEKKVLTLEKELRDLKTNFHIREKDLLKEIDEMKN